MYTGNRRVQRQGKTLGCGRTNKHNDMEVGSFMTEILEEASSYRVNTALELSASESGAGENIGRIKSGPKSSTSSLLGKSYMVPKAKCQLCAGEGGIAVHSDGAERAMKADGEPDFARVLLNCSYFCGCLFASPGLCGFGHLQTWENSET